MYANIRRHSYYFAPKDKDVAETGGTARKFLAVKQGTRVLSVTVQFLKRGEEGVTTSTIGVGDGDSAVGFVADTSLDQIPGTLLAGVGAYLATSGGKLYLADDTIDITYTVNAAGTGVRAARVIVQTVSDL